jgi:hypothetical protein
MKIFIGSRRASMTRRLHAKNASARICRPEYHGVAKIRVAEQLAWVEAKAILVKTPTLMPTRAILTRTSRVRLGVKPSCAARFSHK